MESTSWIPSRLSGAETRRFIHRAEIAGDIEFRHVRFAYPGRREAGARRHQPGAHPPGEKVALIGRGPRARPRSKAGSWACTSPPAVRCCSTASTCASSTRLTLRRNLGHVAQDVTLFYGSLREHHLRHAARDRSAILAVIPRTACLSDFVSRHPRGFDMPVGDAASSRRTSARRAWRGRCCTTCSCCLTSPLKRDGLLDRAR